MRPGSCESGNGVLTRKFHEMKFPGDRLLHVLPSFRADSAFCATALRVFSVCKISQQSGEDFAESAQQSQPKTRWPLLGSCNKRADCPGRIQGERLHGTASRTNRRSAKVLTRRESGDSRSFRNCLFLLL